MLLTSTSISPSLIPATLAGPRSSNCDTNTGPPPRTLKPNVPLRLRRVKLLILEITHRAGGTLVDCRARLITSSLLKPWTFTPSTSRSWSPGRRPDFCAYDSSNMSVIITGAFPPIRNPKPSGHVWFVLGGVAEGCLCIATDELWYSVVILRALELNMYYSFIQKQFVVCCRVDVPR